MLQAFDASVLKYVVNNLANIYVFYVTCATSIIADLARAKQGNETMLLVVPHQMATLSHYQLCTIAATHRKCLATSGWLPTRINAME